MLRPDEWLGATEALLLPLYAQAHRAYHNADHVRALIRLVDSHAHLARDPLALKLAACFHDAVYDTTRQGNEAQSAQMADQHLSDWGCADAMVSSVGNKVRANATHQWADGDPDTALFLDFDLSVLAAPPHVYDTYARQIAQEYAWVPAEAYRAGRAGVLQRFLARPRLYFTEALREQWELQARANLTRELASA
jgi:predicted metal-dependent HD superfamily phosphohydrolase